MKRNFIFAILILIILFTGCGKKDQGDIFISITNDIYDILVANKDDATLGGKKLLEYYQLKEELIIQVFTDLRNLSSEDVKKIYKKVGDASDRIVRFLTENSTVYKDPNIKAIVQGLGYL